MEEELISKDSAINGEGVYVADPSTPMLNNNQGGGAFNLTAQDLTALVNKYKERDENMQDINYFIEKGGIEPILKDLGTDKKNGISFTNGREEHFGSNKVFKKHEKIISTKCGHIFHCKCAYKWFDGHTYCPICKCEI